MFVVGHGFYSIQEKEFRVIMIFNTPSTCGGVIDFYEKNTVMKMS
jgi:hypothetical protein